MRIHVCVCVCVCTTIGGRQLDAQRVATSRILLVNVKCCEPIFFSAFLLLFIAHCCSCCCCGCCVYGPQCTWLSTRLAALLLTLLLLALFASRQTHALEFMDVDESAMSSHDDDNGDESSAELPQNLLSYSKDTIANFNPRKTDAHFRTLWERVPQQKQEVIKRK